MKRKEPTIVQHGSGYRTRLTGPDGKRRWSPTRDTKEQVLLDVAAHVTDVRRGDWSASEGSQCTLDRWFELWMPSRQVADSTIYGDWSTYRNHIAPFLGRRRLADLANSALAIEQWLAWMAGEGASEAMQKRAHTLLKTALGKRGAMGDGRIKSNPCWSVGPRTPAKPKWDLLTKERFKVIFDGLPGNRDRAIVMLATYAGFRWSEIAGLRRKDYNPLRGTLTVEAPVTRQPGGARRGRPKSRKTRDIPVLPPLAQALNDHLAAHPEIGPDDSVFPGERRPTIGYSYWMKGVWIPTLLAVGYSQDNHPRFHDLRHSCASWLLKGGMTIVEVKEIMGHASVTTTELYTHTDADEKAAAMRRAMGF